MLLLLLLLLLRLHAPQPATSHQCPIEACVGAGGSTHRSRATGSLPRTSARLDHWRVTGMHSLSCHTGEAWPVPAHYARSAQWRRDSRVKPAVPVAAPAVQIFSFVVPPTVFVARSMAMAMSTSFFRKNARLYTCTGAQRRRLGLAHLCKSWPHCQLLNQNEVCQQVLLPAAPVLAPVAA